MERHLLATGAINIEERRTGETRISFKQTQWLSILPKGLEKTHCLFSCESDDPHFRNHHRPAENRADGESEENDLARNGGVLKSENESAAREKVRKQKR